MNVPPCEYCGQDDHEVADCPDLAAWRADQELQEMAATAAYYQIPEGRKPL